MGVRAPSLAEHFAAGGPKRILTLDGGGVRGLLSLGFLGRIETLLRERHGNDPAFRLSHYFDLIAGTSTGSILAALLARGESVEQVTQLYLELADKVFAQRWWDPRSGLLRPRYNPQALANVLRGRFGSECRIGDPELLRTGLLVMCKRIDSGSPWPISNNPKGHYFLPDPTERVIANRDYRLWQVVRASTAAPTFFNAEEISISSPLNANQKPLIGQFIDGGVSPHNNPALQAYWLATLKGFGLQWPAGKDQLLIISVGTGRTPVNRKPGWIAALQGVTALRSLMDDCASLVESLMQGLGYCLNEPRLIDSELCRLSPHEMTSSPRFSYARYDVKIFHDPTPVDGQNDEEYLKMLGLSEAQLVDMQKMDNAKPKLELLELGRVAADDKVLADHFPPAFDMAVTSDQVESFKQAGAPAQTTTTPQSPPVTTSTEQPQLLGEVKTYRQREGTQVTAIRLNLEVESFTYHKWGGLQTCKAGDWIVEREGSVHTVAAESFARTYKQIGPATYIKQASVWAAPAGRDGVIKTKEGGTHYQQGDYLVWNDPERKDGYAISKDIFESLYESVSPDEQAD
ncbi:MAG: patatin-like phospholipase family protein [Cyanobacteriota bacterium]|jgi:hypothetical protein